MMQALSLFVIGVGIGWMCGLSVSPVISGVITTLLAIAAGIITSYQTLKREKADKVEAKGQMDARPAALLILGLALAATFGVLARTYHWLEPLQSSYDSTRQQAASGQNSPVKNPQNQGVLFGVRIEECDELMALAQQNQKAFIGEVQKSTLPGAKRFSEAYPDYDIIKSYVEALCQSIKQ